MKENTFPSHLQIQIKVKYERLYTSKLVCQRTQWVQSWKFLSVSDHFFISINVRVFYTYNLTLSYLVSQIMPALSASSWINLLFLHLCVCAGGGACETSLVSSTTKYLRLRTHIFCPSPRINHFSKEPCFHFGEWYYKPRLATMYDCHYWGLLKCF